jgi:predicted Holliday junction resolvase-like endonuclease
MTNNQLLSFLQLQRQIFGVCPIEGKIFRLSECEIYLHKKSEPDWFQKIELAQQRIDNATAKFKDIESLKEDKKGRLKASLAVKKFDKVFKPRKLNPDDSMGVFHPIDYVVFNGMKAGEIKNIILLDSNKKSADEKRLQKSIDRIIEKEKYEWITFRVEDNGNIIQV